MKKFFLFSAAILFSIAMIAFTKKQDNKPVVNEVWEYIGTTLQDAEDPAFYRKLTSTPMFVCEGSAETICRITAPEDPNSNPSDPRPDFNGLNPVDDPEEFQPSYRELQ